MLGIEETIINEKKVMEKLCHPMIMKFYSCAKDEKNIYFILEYI